MSTATVGGAIVEIEISGKIAALVPSLEACLAISKMAGGLAAAMDRCRMLHFETLVAIVGAAIEIDGHKLNPRQQQDLLPKAIYEAGCVEIAAKCIDLILIVGRGGRPLEDEDEDKGGSQDGESPLAP